MLTGKRRSAAWRDLPENFGPCICYNRFVRWGACIAGATCSCGRALEHDPEKWIPVFPRDKREAFARRSCSNKKIERDDDSKKSHPALAKILQAWERLQQPDAGGGYRAGEKADAGDDHQHAHRVLDAGQMPLHSRE